MKKAILIDVIDPKISQVKAKKRLQELENLVKTFGGLVVVKTIQKKGFPDYDTYIGKGKVNEIIGLAEKHKANLLVINNLLKPRQTFSLNEIFRKQESKLKTWDRVDLILKIFDKHAKSTEAKLQIELASIRHMGPRIFGMGIELSRQAGAMGVRAGQGESNIELMKRHLRKQELNIEKKLKHYETIRSGHRKRRKRQNLKTLALVGYTNAGKSTLLNALTNKGAYAADELFATLDTRVGKLFFPGTDGIKDGKYQKGKEVLISDTIGFIQDLPPELIEAFKSTLAETIEADIILHVIDIKDPEVEMKIKVVEDIQESLGLKDTPKIYVFNKTDKLTIKRKRKDTRLKAAMPAGKDTARKLGWIKPKKGEDKLIPKLLKKYKHYTPVFVSAVTKENLEELKEVIKERV